MRISILKRLTGLLACVLLLTTACSKDDYYVDGGLADPIFEGSILQYLESKPVQFDTIVQIIRLGGLEERFQSDEFTFFAPSDEDIKDLIGALDRGGVNRRLYNLGRDTIVTLADVDSVIWRKYLERYMFRGKNKLMDYPQIDFDLLNIYSGQNYYSYSGQVSNIGVVYHDAVSDGEESSIKYMGYRQLHISYIPDIAFPTSWITIRVASSDIQPNNGIVHVLDYTNGEFGFLGSDVDNDILESKR